MAIPVRLKKAAIIVPLAAVALVIGACSGDESGDDQESRSASAGSVEWKPANWEKNPGTAITLINNSTKPIGFSCAQAPKASRIASPLFTVQPGKFFRCLSKLQNKCVLDKRRTEFLFTLRKKKHAQKFTFIYSGCRSGWSRLSTAF